eukprot:6089778-Pyramimonas_sp.AAC.1
MRANLSLFKYADGIWNFMVAARFQRISEFLKWMRMSDETLEEELEEVGFGANRSKQVSLFHVSGVGFIKVKRWLRHHAVSILGSELHESTRYLGPYVSLSGTTGPE